MKLDGDKGKEEGEGREALREHSLGIPAYIEKGERGRRKKLKPGFITCSIYYVAFLYTHSPSSHD